MFKVECPGCKAPYQVDERRIPSSGLKMRCPKCGTSFKVDPPDDARRTGPSPVLGGALGADVAESGQTAADAGAPGARRAEARTRRIQRSGSACHGRARSECGRAQRAACPALERRGFADGARTRAVR